MPLTGRDPLRCRELQRSATSAALMIERSGQRTVVRVLVRDRRREDLVDTVLVRLGAILVLSSRIASLLERLARLTGFLDLRKGRGVDEVEDAVVLRLSEIDVGQVLPPPVVSHNGLEGAWDATYLDQRVVPTVVDPKSGQVDLLAFDLTTRDALVLLLEVLGHDRSVVTAIAGATCQHIIQCPCWRAAHLSVQKPNSRDSYLLNSPLVNRSWKNLQISGADCMVVLTSSRPYEYPTETGWST